MLVLGIETATSMGSVALVSSSNTGTKILGDINFEHGNIHGREIAPAIAKICSESGITPKEIDLIACDLGPGSYTGLRVGLAHAKAISYSLQKPLIGLCSLDVMARKAFDHGNGVYCPMIDAKWGEVYFAIYSPEKMIHPPDHAEPERIVQLLPKEARIFGDALLKWGEFFQDLQILDKNYWYPDARIVAEAGLERYNKGEKADIYSIEPVYLRETEAEKNLERGNERPQSLG